MRNILFSILIGLLATACTMSSEKKETRKEKGEVNIYTHRHYEVDRALFQLFTENTGIKVNVVSASADELIKKLEIEGANSPADILITVDAGRLFRAKELGLLQPINSEIAANNVPKRFIDKEFYWYGITYRARVIAYAKERVNTESIQNYEDLAKPEFKGKVLMRSSENIYNQSLLASMVHHLGTDGASEWTQSVYANLAREPKGNDRDQVKAIAAGLGDLSLVNTYYVGQMLKSENEEEVAAAKSIGLIFPNQGGRGTHINVSGIGVTKHSPNKENAIKLLEFLTSAQAQKLLAEANFEYPVKEGIAWASQLTEWGDFEKDSIDFNALGEHNKQAVEIFDTVGWK